ncbi:hypothetical protein ACU4GD_39865 [Cupriavidus basilensis]
MGEDVLYSGTGSPRPSRVSCWAFPRSPFSQVDKGWTHLDAAARVARDIVERYIAKPAEEPFPAQRQYSQPAVRGISKAIAPPG